MNGPLQAALAGLVCAGCAPLVLRARPGRRAPAGTGVPPAGVAGRVRAAGLLAGLGAAAVAAVATAGPRSAPAAETFLVVVLVLVAVVDVRVRRLPNVAVLPATAVVVALLVLTEVRRPAAGSLGSALLALAVGAALLTAAALAVPLRFGMGDARFMALPLPVLAHAGPQYVPALLAVLGVISALLLRVLLRRDSGGSLVPFGPLVALSVVLVLAADGPALAAATWWQRTWA